MPFELGSFGRGVPVSHVSYEVPQRWHALSGDARRFGNQAEICDRKGSPSRLHRCPPRRDALEGVYQPVVEEMCHLAIVGGLVW